MEQSPPKVIPVKDPDEEPDISGLPPIHPHLPQISGHGGGALLLMISPVKTGKCLHFSTLIETKDVGYTEIKNVKIGQYVNSQNGFIRVKNVFNQGIKDCSKITINDNELILTKDHKLETSEGMKALKDIKEEVIITKNGSYHISNKEDNFESGACYDLEVDHQDHTFYSNDISVSNSTIISNLLLNKDFYDAQERFDTTTIISNTIANCVTSRFLKDAFDVYDYYDDNIIDGIIQKQKEFKKKEEQPQICIVCDDCLGSIKREAKLNHLSSRFRHYNIKLLVLSSQKFTGAVSPVIRANATNVIVGSPFPNQKELNRIGEEYGDLFGGQDMWLALYKASTPERYDFIHMSIQDNPPIMYKNFDEVVAIGNKPQIPIDLKNFSVEENNIDNSQKDNV
jgi:hypothetical protein